MSCATIFGLDLSDNSQLALTLEGKGSWGSLFVNVIVFLVVVSTISFAIGTVEDVYAVYEPVFTGIEYFCVVVFTIEYLLRVSIAQANGRLLSYLVQPISIIDLLSILPSWVDLFIVGDAFPALQFLRMLRIFKFLSTSERGSRASAAFQQSWEENRGLILAASFAGGAVWLVTASLLYYAERDNEDMDWCYPPSTATSSSKHHCVCDGDGCEGSECECVKRFGSIPSAMFFVLLNLSGEYPLAQKHSTIGRFVCVATAVLSVGIFAIPTGLIGASLEGAIGALNVGDEADYDVDEDDVAEIAAEARALLHRNTSDAEKATTIRSPLNDTDLLARAPPPAVPAYTVTNHYKVLVGVLICLSATASVASTVSAIKNLPATVWTIFGVDLFCAIFFLFEHAARTITAGADDTMNTFFSSPLAWADLLSWLPTFLYALGGVYHCPSYILLTISLFRMLKFERYSRGFQILSRVIAKSQGVLAVGGMAAACCLVFCSTLMYYAERNNPDPNMSKYYNSVPTAMWITLLNLSGEAPLCDYTLSGRFIVGMLSVVAVAVFAVPVGALGAGFEEVIGELVGSDDGENAEGNTGVGEGEGKEERDEETGAGTGAREGTPLTGGKSDGYGAVEMTVTKVKAAQRQSSSASLRATANSYGVIESDEHELGFSDHDDYDDQYQRLHSGTMQQRKTFAQRLVDGQGTRGYIFQTISVLATLFAVGLEVVSTCEFATQDASARDTIALLETCAVAWFTVEFLIRTWAHGARYICSGLGLVDIAATLPWYLARGLCGDTVAGFVDQYDGPLRAVRLLRLVRLDTYAPSVSLVGEAFRSCWSGLSVACYAGLVLWFLFNTLLYFAEREDEEFGEAQRFRSALSSLQFSGVLLTGDYPIVDFTPWGRLLCAGAVVVAVGIVAVPASVLAGAFVSLLEEKAEERRNERYEAAVKCQRLFLARKHRKEQYSRAGSAFHAVVRDAITHSVVLRGLDSTNPPVLARICIWKNGKSRSAAAFHSFVALLIFLNIAAVVLESVPSIESALPHFAWQLFETLSVIFFTAEYVVNLLTAKYDPKWSFNRRKMATSFIGMADLLAIVPFYIQLFDLNGEFDATIFRIFRLARILEYERFFTAFSLLDDVFVKAAPVLKATGVMALIVWVGGATIFYYSEPHSSADPSYITAAAQGGEDAAVFVSIVDALYYCAIFLAGEWAVVDFTPVGGLFCTIMAIIGVALFSIPVGVLFEGFQEMLEEKHAHSAKND